MNIGKAIKELRKQKGLSQIDLAQSAQITQAALSQIENGKRPGINTINKICKALEVSESFLYLIGMDEMDVPKRNQDLYKQLFPVIKDLVLKLAIN